MTNADHEHGETVPPTIDIDLTSMEVMTCPYATYEKLREDAPIHRTEAGKYVVTRYAEVVEAFTDHEHFSRDMVGFFDPERPTRTEIIWHSAEARRIFREEGWESWPQGAVLFSDPPLHTRYRKFVEPMFSVKRINAMKPEIQSLIDTLIDSFIARGEAEFVSEFAVPLPMKVICRILGFPDEDLEKLKSLSNAMGDAMSYLQTEEEQINCARKLVEGQHYFVEQLHRKRREPADDVLSELAKVAFGEEDGFGLPEILSLISSMLIGGNESTTNALSSGLWLMLEKPDALNALRSDPSLIRTFVEETLRLESPFQFFTRATRHACTFAGARLEPGDLVDVCLGSANRDPRQFPDPDRLDLNRKGSATHVAFGAGIHRCLGNVLARFELALAFETLLRRLDNPRLAERNTFERMRHPIFRGLKELHITFDSRTM